MAIVEDRWRGLRRLMLAGVFPAVLIAAVAAFGILQLARRSHPATLPSAAGTAGHAFVVLLAAGFASMATIQVAKSLLGLRGVYQQRQIQLWFSRPSLSDDGGRNYRGYEELRAALRLGQKSRGIFDLPIEQLSAQISIAADFASTMPLEFSHFLADLTAGSGTLAASRKSGNEPHAGTGDTAQIELHYYVRAGVDQLQATVGYRWRNYVRATAMWLSGLFGIVIVEASRVPPRERGLDILAALVIGGFISWFTRDITAAVERLRG